MNHYIPVIDNKRVQISFFECFETNHGNAL